MGLSRWDSRIGGPPGPDGFFSFWKRAATAISYQVAIAGVQYTVSITSFGALINATASALNTDDIPLNAALVYITALGGGELYADEGDYNLADPVDYPGDNLIITGSGRNTLFDGVGLADNEHAIQITGRDDCTVRNLAVQNPAGGGLTRYCILIENGSDRTMIERVVIVQSDHDAIHITGTTLNGGWIIDCEILSCDETGIYFRMDADVYVYDFIISGNRLVNCIEGGIHLGNPPLGYAPKERIIITENIIVNCTGLGAYGIEVGTRAYRCIIANNIARNCYGGIALIGVSHHSTVDGNVAYENLGFGFYFSGLYSSFCNNVSYDNGGNGIECNAARYSTINGNTSSENTQHGFTCWNMDNNIMSDNVSYANDSGNTGTYDGLAINASSDYNYITDNYFIDNDRYGVSVAAGATGNVIKDNIYRGNTVGSINDAGTDTRVHEIVVEPEDRDASRGDHPVAQMLDDVSTTVRFGFGAPDEFQEAVTAQVVIIPAANGTLRRQVETDFGKVCSGEAYNAHSDAIAAGDVAGMIQDDLECIDVSAALTGLAARDTVGMRFIRDATAGSGDTIVGTVWVKEFRMRFV